MDIEQEASDTENGRELEPSTLLHKASRARNLPVMAEALAHNADVNSVNEEEESKSALIQAVTGVRLVLNAVCYIKGIVCANIKYFLF